MLYQITLDLIMIILIA